MSCMDQFGYNIFQVLAKKNNSEFSSDKSLPAFTQSLSLTTSGALCPLVQATS